MLMNAILEEICFHLRKSAVTFAKRIIKDNRAFIACELWFQKTIILSKQNSIIGKQFIEENINYG